MFIFHEEKRRFTILKVKVAAFELSGKILGMKTVQDTILFSSWSSKIATF